MQGAEECAPFVGDSALYHKRQHIAQNRADMLPLDSKREHIFALEVEHCEVVAALQRKREVGHNLCIAARSAKRGKQLHTILPERKECLLQCWNRRLQRIMRDGLGDSLAVRVVVAQVLQNLLRVWRRKQQRRKPRF